LVFGSRNDPGYLELDDISLVQVVPEPNSAMLAGIVSGLVWILRKRLCQTTWPLRPRD
jgi:hypothetical protein